LPGLPAARVGHEHLAGFVHAVKLKAHLAPGGTAGHAGLQLVEAGGRNLHSVFEPFVAVYPTDIETAAGVSSRLNIDTGAAVSSAVVGRICIVIGNAIATLVEVFGLHSAWHRQRLIEKR